MPVYTLTGPIRINATIVIDAEDEIDAWAQIDLRLRPTLVLDGYSKYEETSAEISKMDLSIGRTA